MKATATYEARAEKHSSEVARTLLTLMAQKKTNLCVSVDVTTKAALLRLVDAVGPYCCLIKTHIDILSDFDEDTITSLQKLSAKHNFLFFEDRKFADIGNTVQLQYAAGVYKIASWSHITNAHAVPGEGIIKGLKAVGSKLGQRGLIMLAEMSSAGTLATGEYARQTLEMARRHRDFVFGFIAMHRIQDDHPVAASSDEEEEDFLILTPGVGLDVKGDGMGQQYRTPHQVVGESGCDVIIVGRGIYGQGEGHEDVNEIVKQAKRYQEAGWDAYVKRVAL